MRLSDEGIRGKTVISAEGQAIGDVAALLFDSESWHVDSIRVKLRKQVADHLGAQRGRFHAGTVDLPVRMIQSVRDTVVLSVATEELRKIVPNTGSQAAD